MDAPRAGVHYPRPTGELQAWFRTDADCLDYLEWLRWPAGFSCPDCVQRGGWRLGDDLFMCAGCGGRTSVAAGTVFDKTRTPPDSVVQRVLSVRHEQGRRLGTEPATHAGDRPYQTAWAMLHRPRAVLVRPEREQLSGAAEVDETFIGGQDSGLRGGRVRGKKVLTVIAAEVIEPRGFGRRRMARVADACAVSLHTFVTEHVGGTLWFLDEIWPLVRRTMPTATVAFVGSSAPRELTERNDQDQGVEVVSNVSSMQPYLRAADAFIVPLRMGGGRRLKVLEALASGLPVVSTHKGVEGLRREVHNITWLADEAAGFAAACIQALEDAPARRAAAPRGRTIAEKYYEWSSISAEFAHWVEQLANA